MPSAAGTESTPPIIERMNDSSRVESLRFLRRYLLREVERVERWIAVEEDHERALAVRRPPPPPPEWVIERGISHRREPIAVHTGDCRMRGKALTVRGIRPCQLCRPDTALGVLE